MEQEKTMAKEIAISKRLKITEAQQYTLLSVFVASLFLGVAISLISSFVNQISFNINVIAEEEKTIVNYSNTIKNIGICKSPNGSIYTDEELKKCDPDGIEVSEIPNTLRANIIEDLAANEALNSVPNVSNSSCIDPLTSKNYTYKELSTIYEEARGSEELSAASQLIRSCSALRVIPDALPSTKNEEALLASLNQLFKVSNWEPESLSPSGDTEASTIGTNLNTISLNVAIETDSSTTMNVLSNIERSIREFNIQSASIEWSGDNLLQFRAQAQAYYMESSSITESTKTVSAETGKVTTKGEEE
jgi:hypothetical protein